MTRLFRRAAVLACVLLATGSRPTWAQLPYVAFEQITIDNTAGGLSFTAAKITPAGSSQATVATCALETADVRYTIDGTTPTASVGVPWPAGSTLTFIGHDILDHFKAIRSGGSNGKLSCTYSAAPSSGANTVQSVIPGLSPGATVSNTVAVASNGATAAAVPAQADYIGVNIAGNLTGVTGFSVGTARAPAMAIVDGSGNQITTFGGGTQYATGAAQATPTGTVALGWDATNVRALSTNSSGQLQVVFPSAQAVSGTVTANAGTGNFTVVQATAASLKATAVLNDGSGNAITSTTNALDVNIKSGGATGVAQGSTTSGQLGTLTQGAVTTAAPSYTTAQTSPISLDTSGQLRTVVGGTVALAAETTKNIGTVRLADSSGNGIASNANAGTRAIAAVIYDASGNAITAFSGSGGTASNFGSAVPSAGTASGFSDGTNMRMAEVVDANGGAGTEYVLKSNIVSRGAAGASSELFVTGNAGYVQFPSAQAVTAAQTGTWNITNVSGTVSLPTGASTAAKQPALGTAGTASADVLSVQGIASMTPLLVTLSGTNTVTTVSALTGGGVAHDGVGTAVNPLLVGGYASAAAPTDVSADGDATRLWVLRNGSTVTQAAYAGTLASTGNGTSGAGVPRVTLASDSTGQVTLATGANTIGALTANQTVNVAQINGVATTMGNGVAGTGVQRVTIASDSTANIATIGTSVTPGTGATNLGKAEDAAHTSGDVGIMNLAVRESTSTDLSANTANGDYEPLEVDAAGRLWTNPFPASPAAGTYIPIRLSDGSSFITPSTDFTHDGALTVATTSGPAIIVRASAAAPTNVSADDDAVLPWALRNGSLVTNLAAGSTLITSTSSSLNVNCTGGCSGGTQYTQDGALTVGTSVVTLSGGRASAAVPSDVSADNDAVIAWYLRSGAQAVNPTFGGVLATAGNGVSGTGVQRVTLASDSTGQVTLATGANTIGALSANQTINLAQVAGTNTVTGGTAGSLGVGGTVAHDGVGTGVSPLLMGGYASAAAPSDVSNDGDATRLWVLRNGSPVANLAAGGTLITADVGASSSALRVAFATSSTTGVTQATAANLKAQVAQLASISTSGTLQSAVTASGNGSTLAVDGMSSAILTVNCATCSGGTTVNFEASEDGSNFTAVSAVQIGTTTIATTTTTAGVTVWDVPVGGFQTIRARVSGYSAGTITVTGHTVPVSYNPKVVNTNAIESGTWTVQPGNTANTTPWLVSLQPTTAGGLTTYTLEPTASDNHANIKNGAGTVYHIVAFNNSATVNYYRLYNAATGFNGCNSATNLVWEGHIPASTSDAGFVEDIAQGLNFSTGISICVTGAYGQTSVTNATASAISLNVGYK